MSATAVAPVATAVGLRLHLAGGDQPDALLHAQFGEGKGPDFGEVVHRFRSLLSPPVCPPRGRSTP